MMKIAKRIAAAALGVAMVASLTACDSVGSGTQKDTMKEDSQTYVQGLLDKMYLGKYNKEYLDLIDLTETEAEEDYLDRLYGEVDYFCYVFGIEYQDDELNDQIAEMYKQIYAKAKYTVDPATKLESGNYAVEVSVEPIEIFTKITQEEHSAMDDEAFASLGKTEDELNAMSEEESEQWYQDYDRAYAEGMVELVLSHMDDLTYGDAKSMVFQLAQDSDGYYSLVEGDLQNFDQYIIAY